jgi:pimeloyl-ACP methyl ester carboxylesterase
MSNPALLLVPGAWHKPSHFRLLREELRDIDVHSVTLTSSGDDPAALGDMYSDAEVIARAAKAIDGPVVVLAHSYGAVPTTQALAGTSNIRHILYLAAWQLRAGESVVSFNRNSHEPWSKLHRREGGGDYIEALTPTDVFYNDVEPETARRAASELGYQSYISIRQELTQTAWEEIPSTYIVCEADNAIPVAIQEGLAQRADRIRRLNASHSPFLSQPAALARLIRQLLVAA